MFVCVCVFQCSRFKKFEQLDTEKENLLAAKIQNAEAIKWMKENKVVMTVV